MIILEVVDVTITDATKYLYSVLARTPATMIHNTTFILGNLLDLQRREEQAAENVRRTFVKLANYRDNARSGVDRLKLTVSSVVNVIP